MPARDPDEVQAFWERAGFIALEAQDEPLVERVLTGDALNLGLHSPRALPQPLLLFSDADMAARLAALAALDIAFSADLPRGLDRDTSALLEAPEGTLLLLTQEAT